MSSLRLVFADSNGDFSILGEPMGNSFRGLPLIWSYCVTKAGYRGGSSELGDRIPRDIYKLDAISPSLKACFVFGFDGAYIRQENFSRFCDALKTAYLSPALERKWGFMNPDQIDLKDSHCLDMSEQIRCAGAEVRAVGAWGTSVIANPWEIESKNEEYKPINLDDASNRYSEIFEVFDLIDGL